MIDPLWIGAAAMNDVSIEAGEPDSPDRPVSSGDRQVGDAGAPDFKAADYCQLAEECFFLAAMTKDTEAAAELLKAGDDYLRRAAEWLADRLKNG
jgi:hypothetical protein